MCMCAIRTYIRAADNRNALFGLMRKSNSNWEWSEIRRMIGMVVSWYALPEKKYGIFEKHNGDTRIWHFDLLKMAWHQSQTSIAERYGLKMRFSVSEINEIVLSRYSIIVPKVCTHNCCLIWISLKNPPSEINGYAKSSPINEQSNKFFKSTEIMMMIITTMIVIMTMMIIIMITNNNNDDDNDNDSDKDNDNNNSNNNNDQNNDNNTHIQGTIKQSNKIYCHKTWYAFSLGKWKKSKIQMVG